MIVVQAAAAVGLAALGLLIIIALVAVAWWLLAPWPNWHESAEEEP